MNFFRNMTIGRRILFGLSLPLIAVIVLGPFIITTLRSVDAKNDDIRENHLPGAILLGDIATEIADLNSDQLRYSATTSASDQAELETTMNGIIDSIKQSQAAYAPLIHEDDAAYKLFENKWHEYTATHEAFLQSAKAHKTQDAAKLLVQSDDLFDAMAADLTKLISANQETATRIGRESDVSFAFVQKAVYVGILTLVLFSILAGWYMKAGANQISGVVKNTVEQLIKLSLALSASTQQASAAAQQNAAIAQQVASGATQQSAQAEGISKALTQMSQAVAQMATTSHEVSESTIQASKLAQQTGQSTEKIGKMAEVVTTTAEQTNLLALNAAIEAARAGDAGRGFAVVADEVRKLADSSSKAAQDVQQIVKEIAGSISSTVGGISASSLKIGDVAAGINQQAAAINQVAKTMDSIAAVAGQSAAGAQQLSASTQQTSAATQQIAAASTDLQRLADKLQKIVSGALRKDNAPAGSHAAPAAPTASQTAKRLTAFPSRTPSVYHATEPSESVSAHDVAATSPATNNSSQTSEPN